jgi:hypothetical protein
MPELDKGHRNIVKKGQVVRHELFFPRQELVGDGLHFRKLLMEQLKYLVEICADAFVGSLKYDVRVVIIIQEERE